jgi:hypothetical protein
MDVVLGELLRDLIELLLCQEPRLKVEDRSKVELGLLF